MGKIFLNNIAEELAVKSNIAGNAAEGFLRVFVETIEKGLQEDGIVKVKGLGTFKLIEMGERSSVDVNTGERILIKGHTKVSFTPDSTMKELINRPFAHFEPTELNDGFPTDDEPVESDDTVEETESVEEVEAAKEVVETVSEVVEEAAPAEVPAENSTDELAEEVAQDSVEETPEETVEAPVVEATEVAEPHTDDAVQPAQAAAVANEESAETPDATASSHAETESQPQAQGKKRRGCGCVLSILLLLLCAVALYYWYTSEGQSYQEKTEEFSDIVVNPNLQEVLGVEWEEELSTESAPVDSVATPSEPVATEKSEVVEEVQKEQEKSEKQDTATTDKAETETVKTETPAVKAEPSVLVIPESLVAKELKDITIADTTDYTIAGTLATHKLKNGETIISLARKYYGDKRLWPYIVKHNRITDFNKVAIGMEVNIPELCLNED